MLIDSAVTRCSRRESAQLIRQLRLHPRLPSDADWPPPLRSTITVSLSILFLNLYPIFINNKPFQKREQYSLVLYKLYMALFGYYWQIIYKQHSKKDLQYFKQKSWRWFTNLVDYKSKLILIDFKIFLGLNHLDSFYNHAFFLIAYTLWFPNFMFRHQPSFS